jgi:hypothetical protein
MGVYALIGWRFPLFQLMVNYLLEIVPQEEHALALGVTNTLTIVTAPMPLLFGLATLHLGYGPIMALVSVIIIANAVVALRLQEPRDSRQ